MGSDLAALAPSLLAVLRVAPVCVLAARLAPALLPPPLSLSLALALGVALTPAAGTDGAAAVSLLAWLALGARELAIGSMLATAMLLPVAALGWAMRWFEHTLQLPAVTRAGPLARLYGLLAVLGFFALSGHLALVRGIAATFADVPLGPPRLDWSGFALGVAGFVMDAFALAFALALPLLVAGAIAAALVTLVARAFSLSPSLDGAVRAPVFVLLAALMLAPLSARVPEAVRAGVSAAQSRLRDIAR